MSRMFDTWEKKERERERGMLMMIREKRGLCQVIAQCAPKNRDELLCPDYTHASGNYILQVLQGRGLRFAIV